MTAVAAELAQVPLFQGVTSDALTRLADRATSRRIEAGTWLFREGDSADCLYVVRSGRLQVIAVGDDGPRVVRELGPRAALGELALLSGSPRAASVRAVRDSELLEVGGSAFAALLDEDPGLGRAVATELARQLQASGGRASPSTRPRVFAVIPLRQSDDAQRLAAGMRVEFERHGSVALLKGDEGSDGPAALLDQAERAADAVLLVAGSGGSEWDAFARRQADRTLLVVDETTQIGADASGCDLVLLAPLATGRTARWLAAAGPSTHHLVYEAAFGLGAARVARRVSGRSLGVVLSGGGARGFAHIGVIAALADAGLEVDRLGGCSMGAYVGAMSALGLDAGQIRDRCHEEFVRRTPFNDWTVPRVALIRSRKAARMLERVFGELQVEELPRPLFTVSADLLTSRTVVHRQGSLLEAVGASMSIPGLVPPVARAGRLLVDGGVLNNLPVDLMHGTSEGPIVAVDVVRRLGADSTEIPRLPSIMETMTRATMLGSVERAERNRELATIVISPEVQDIGLREFKALDRAVAAGREAAVAALAEGGADALREALYA